MKVKIGDKFYNSNEQPIMIVFEDDDKKNINNMEVGCSRYCSFPDEMDIDDIEKFMTLEKELHAV
jgi:hypothetical protein